MTLERYLGYHFSPTSVLIAEAFASRTDQLQWEIFKQPNYELPPEWLALYKEAIPNLYDTQQQVFGFQALPAIWSGLTHGRFHRYDSEYFRAMAQGKLPKSALTELNRFLKYSLVYHIKPQPDEHLYVTLVVEDLSNDDLEHVLITLNESMSLPNLTFINAISPQPALLQALYYRALNSGVDSITDQTTLAINVGYIYTEFTLWTNGEAQVPVRAQGMRQIDMGVCSYLQQTNDLARTLDLGDLVIYAQRARADYENEQDEIPIFQPGNSQWMTVGEGEYLRLIQEGVDDIIRRLNRVARAQPERIDHVIISGEGAVFAPIADHLRSTLAELSLPNPEILAHSAVTCAQGAAAWSYAVWNSMRETQ